MNTTDRKHTAQRPLPLLLAVALMLLLPVACDKGIHDGEYPLPGGQGALVIGLESHAEVTDLTVCIFREGSAAPLYKVYADPRALASEYIPVNAGSYTLIIAANAAGAALPQEATVADLAEWLKAHAGDYPALQTASAQMEVTPGGIHRLSLALQDGTSGIRLATVALRLALPDKTMPEYPASRAAGSDSRSLRCVAEVYQAGTGNRVHRRVQACALQPDGTFLAELSLMPGDYDLRLWADWDGGYYNADDLGKVLVLTGSYVANGETDKKDAFYAAETLSVTDGTPDKPLALTRPFARYRLIATDVEAYYNLKDKGEALPDIEDLQVRVTYEGFFPTGFSVATGKPNDALNTGIHYTSVPTVAEGYDAAVNRQVGADFVLANGEESFVNVTIEMVDARTGETVATVQHVKIPYKRGHLTTVTGHFLTAGKTPGGVQIDTEWDDIVIEF